MTRVTFRLDELEDAVRRVDAIVGRSLLKLAAIDAVNAVVKRADVSLRKAENVGINLTDAYIESLTRVSPAKGKPRAELATIGDTVTLGRYPFSQLYQPAKGRARGDPKRGIPAGSKQHGIRADVTRGSPTYASSWFTMTLRRGSSAGSQVGIFRRTGNGTVKHLYGPAPYSLFRYQIGAQEAAISEDLAATVIAASARVIEDALA